MAGLAAMAAAVALTALRMPAALALMLAGAACLAWTGSLERAWDPLAALLSAPDLALVPLVLMLGNTAFYAGFATGVHDAAAVALQGRRGGLALAAIGGCAGFAAASGSSLGCAATMSRIALPAMLRAGYDPRLAGASVAMGGTLGALLPPSMLLIVWGLLSGTPVGAMILAGLLPALLSLAGMIATVLWWVWRDPQAAPLPQPQPIPASAVLRAVWPAPVLFAIIVGGIWSGLLTPVAAVTACLALVLALGLVQRRLTPETLWSALRETLRQTAAILLVLVAATLFLAFLERTGIPAAWADWAADMPRLGTLALLALACATLALLAEPVAMLVLLLPFALALAQVWGLDAVWAGVVLVKLVETALVLPPFGLIAVVVATASKTVPPGPVLSGILRFLFADLLVLAAIVLFPALTGWP
ncbi:TRAP transporter large permease subunit [Paracoccus shandongensis]|uniref:TRAP transporter large permease subunit n=1 Tax=Paracoccus shandongensis TaxID=2816048 RepID=UPI001A8EBBF4|nr:TRAP transporter large permease subunit [Paracoccus shandongensis]